MFLVVVETQRVKGYLFASRILRETRGASLLLDRLNREEARKLARKWHGAAIYLGGGSGRVTFERREEAEGFVRELRELYRTEARDARVSVELVEREPGEGFVSWVNRGVERSRLSKRAAREPVPLIGGRWLRPCTSCGQRPAESAPGRNQEVGKAALGIALISTVGLRQELSEVGPVDVRRPRNCPRVNCCMMAWAASCRSGPERSARSRGVSRSAAWRRTRGSG